MNPELAGAAEPISQKTLGGIGPGTNVIESELAIRVHIPIQARGVIFGSTAANEIVIQINNTTSGLQFPKPRCHRISPNCETA